MSLNKYAECAQYLDSIDELKHIRERFLLPKGNLSPHKIYLCSNSLGLPLKTAFIKVSHHMNKWADEGAHGWFLGDDNWYSSLDKTLKESLAHVLGAKENEVVVMNSLTVNLHLLMISFYRPTKKRYKILIDSPTFPSDLYAIKSHLLNQGLDPNEALIILQPRKDECLLRTEDVKKLLEEEGEKIALVFLNAVNFLSGQALDIQSITKLAHKEGCVVGYDLAHAAGNIVLELHKHQVDFAIGCSYKYLCSGPGGPGFAFVHTKHHQTNFPRLSGWWGNNPETRFQMDSEINFLAHGGASSWQVSTPSILAVQPFLASLELFKEVGIDAFRKKSQQQTTFLLELLAEIQQDFSIITPLDPIYRGSQISIQIKNAKNYVETLAKQEVLIDFRPPHIIRVSPFPLYNTFTEIYRFVERFSVCLV